MKRILSFVFAAVLSGSMAAAHAQESQDIPARLQDKAARVESAQPDWSRSVRARHGDKQVAVGHDVTLEQGRQADSVVAVFGSVDSAGEVSNEVVAVLGSARVTGPVGKDVSTVIGNLYLDSKVGGNVSVVMGNLTLGPQADIAGNVSVVGGTLDRDAMAKIGGKTDLVAAGKAVDFGWMRTWFEECFMYGRPLALQPGLGWAWGLAIGFLVFYVLLALAFRGAFDRCIQTLETRPGRSVLASLLTLVLTPVVFVLVFFTIIGIMLLPFMGLALFCLGLFGKAVVLAVLGRRFTGYFGAGVRAQHAFAVLLGGILVLALYLVPVVGFIVYKLLGILGLGVVMYTLVLAARANKDSGGNASMAAAAPQAPSPGEPAPGVAALSAIDATLPRAGFWIRMGALAIDLVIISVLTWFLPFDHGISLVLLATYGALMWKLRSTTIGGIVFGLQVVRTDGRPVDWATAIVRALGCFLSLLVAGLGFLWIAFDGQKQGWHDKIAGTVVVRVPKGISLL